ncbi:hypothetical protein TBLA_0F01450 [Henningerozyma blattae CBS 6284]|uniref:Thioesterase domain-containing protein n=1 Tax=Henningerozyma blattae (strain ATCC 34711 / CBS 6284 / DSM 70876 / NBRC 10599 / NRRL Y-10934 / UCD 77-7) TaxID=1071380 RepID=I2H5N6_HENB6|nr:hypothetical protein TBLA_0F01450 [Tetrapisispora blattae CBS 6284]CCH61688.1 hypothetical protein TBLA_0F01450 [Tetrapisispora blattae CBS 6284]
MSIFKLINRGIILPTAGFSLGILTFMKAWPDEAGSMTLHDSLAVTKDSENLFQQRYDILQKISHSKFYQRLLHDSSVEQDFQSNQIPDTHRPFHVGQGQLFGPGKLEIDPVIFSDPVEGKIVVFYHLGKSLGNEKGQVHKGVLALLLDEALCYCGFPSLPNKRGVTAKLELDFLKDIPIDSTIILRAEVVEKKGRKVVIDGTLETLPRKLLLVGLESERGSVFAKATCILVEPKWFKYLSKLNIM